MHKGSIFACILCLVNKKQRRNFRNGLIVAIGFCLAAYIFLNCLGFTSEGPRSDSYASSFQSSFGDIPGESIFALLQSLGQNFKPILKIGCAIGLVFWIRKLFK